MHLKVSIAIACNHLPRCQSYTCIPSHTTGVSAPAPVCSYPQTMTSSLPASDYKTDGLLYCGLTSVQWPGPEGVLRGKLLPRSANNAQHDPRGALSNCTPPLHQCRIHGSASAVEKAHCSVSPTNSIRRLDISLGAVQARTSLI